MRGLGEQGRLDAELAALAGEDAALRLRLGQVLEVLSRGGHCFSLGFSSVSAYALERCERSSRWVEGARCLARRLEALPELRQALAGGQVSWSLAELVARVAQSADERSWLECARGHTVRELRQLVRGAERHARERAINVGVEEGERVGTLSRQPAEPDSSECEEEACTLTCTVDREDAWLFEATQKLLEQLGTRGSEAQVEALLAEGQETLLAALPRGSIDPDRWEYRDVAQQRWREQLQRWQAEAEERCEERIRNTVLQGRARQRVAGGVSAASAVGEVSAAAAAGCGSLEGSNARELDERVRELSRALARHEFELSRRMLAFHRADGWRALGYATESQYARERLGLSRSTLVARRALAARLEALPAVAEALGAGRIGVDAALQLVRVATPRTEVAWLDRAQHRTSKHLREEVAAALSAVRLSGEADCPPPAEAELEAYAELERAVVSGRASHQRPGQPSERVHREGVRRLLPPGSESRRAWLVMLASLEQYLREWLEGGPKQGLEGGSKAGLEGGIQMSAARRSPRALASAGRVELRLRVSRGLYAWWRGLEAQALRWLPRGMGWLKFLCLSLWRAWRHVLGASVAYGGIYLRDGYRCRSPVCTRKDVTPHHLRFRSQGGGDAAANLASVCTWCHLFGIHGGRIRAEGTADRIRWELGPPGHPCLVVDGRDRRAA